MYVFLFNVLGFDYVTLSEIPGSSIEIPGSSIPLQCLDRSSKPADCAIKVANRTSPSGIYSSSTKCRKQPRRHLPYAPALDTGSSRPYSGASAELVEAHKLVGMQLPRISMADPRKCLH